MNINLLETATPANNGGGWTTLLIYGGMLILIVVAFIFMNRKQKKQEKEITDMRNNLRVGDEVVTTGGIVGRIVRIKEETVVVETSRDGTKIRFLKSSISKVTVPVEAPTSKEEKSK